MKKYRIRKKPLLLECVLWDGSNIGDICEFTEMSREQLLRHPSGDHKLLIDTLEGSLTVSPGNYIIKGIKGEFYPITASILKQTYSFIDGTPPQD